MKRIGDIARVRAADALFKGVVERQPVVGEEISRELYLGAIHFKDGAANKWHVHSCDQILVVTAGEGTVADETEERMVSAGDIAFIPKNTKHWHGARSGKDMTHWSILAGGKTTLVED